MSIRFDRLKQIAEDVRNAPPEQFDMSAFRCGTSACAIGWHMHFHPECPLRFYRMFGADGVEYRNAQGCDAVALYLGLSEAEAIDLFGATDFNIEIANDRETVARRIESFIAAHRESPVIEMKADAAAPVAARQLEGESV